MKKDRCVGREAPERQRTLDVAAGWNKPANVRAEQAVERLRKPEDGTKWGRGDLAKNRSCSHAMPRRGKGTQWQMVLML
jgi:hypothetical protein